MSDARITAPNNDEEKNESEESEENENKSLELYNTAIRFFKVLQKDNQLDNFFIAINERYKTIKNEANEVRPTENNLHLKKPTQNAM